jgi:hypothetical protein
MLFGKRALAKSIYGEYTEHTQLCKRMSAVANGHKMARCWPEKYLQRHYFDEKPLEASKLLWEPKHACQAKSIPTLNFTNKVARVGPKSTSDAATSAKSLLSLSCYSGKGALKKLLWQVISTIDAITCTSATNKIMDAANSLGTRKLSLELVRREYLRV